MIIQNAEEIKFILDNDGVIAYVTDTVWGLGCLPDSEKAVKKIYEIKYQEDIGNNDIHLFARGNLNNKIYFIFITECYYLLK